ncbi:hypothetical protein GCM10018785_27330 [Streptomyces longispororuber]|uniref:Uncharacterized protein n=1 Tax=Streptomyces longispororuber TaxID=68230 RepID=A0A918ZKP3_9ACTN|nr:hypothetical protein GCM10018785_27330 [Streptomyces longispororuber]
MISHIPHTDLCPVTLGKPRGNRATYKDKEGHVMGQGTRTLRQAFAEAPPAVAAMTCASLRLAGACAVSRLPCRSGRGYASAPEGVEMR